MYQPQNMNQNMNQNTINGGNTFGQPLSPPLVIDDLPFECGEADLLLLLQPFGRVKSMNVTRHPQKRCLYCVVDFYNGQQAEVARSMLDGSMFKGVKLRVFWQPPQQNNFNAQQGNNSPNQPSNQRFVRTAQVHISYLSKQLNLVVSEDFLRDIFSNFGEVLEVSLKKVAIDPEMCIQNGYGFVHFPLTNDGIKSALQAVEALHQVTINHISYDCSVSNQLRQVLSQMERNPAMKNQLSQGGNPFGGQQGQYNGPRGQPNFHNNGNFNGDQIPYGTLPPRGGYNQGGSAYQNRQFHQNQGFGGNFNGNNGFPPALYGQQQPQQFGRFNGNNNYQNMMGGNNNGFNDFMGMSNGSLPMPPPRGPMGQRSPNGMNSISPPPSISNANPLGLPANANAFAMPSASSSGWGSFHSSGTTPPTPSSLSSLSSSRLHSQDGANNSSLLFEGGSLTKEALGSSLLSSTELDSLNLTSVGSTSLDGLNAAGSPGQKIDVSALLDGNNGSTSLLVPNPGKFPGPPGLRAESIANISAVTSVGNISPFPSEASTDGEQVFNREFGEYVTKPSSALSFGTTNTLDMSGPSWGSFKASMDNVFDLNTATSGTAASISSSNSKNDDLTNLKTELSVDEQLEALWFEN